MTYKPNFTQQQKDWICYQIGDWYLMMKPLLEGQHNLGYMKEKLKLMVCDDNVHTSEKMSIQEDKCPNDCENGRIPVSPLGYVICPICKGHGVIK